MSERKVVQSQNGMVACSQPLAAEIGVDVLKRGGSAVDAAIASNAALGLMEPHMCGIGGDLFAIVWDAKSKQLYGLNASGRSPMNLDSNELKQQLQIMGTEVIPPDGLLSVSVPGAVDGWAALHARFGALPFSDLFTASIDYAENGFALTPVIAGEWQTFSERESHANSAFTQTFRPDGRAPSEGEYFKNLNLANCYRLVSKEGRRPFYEGDIGKTIDQFMSDNGGYISQTDLKNNHVDWVTPLSVNYRGHDVYELPPNGQGMAALQMFNLIRRFDMANLSEQERIHYMVEAKKLAYEDRARFYADPDFAPAPLDGLLSPEYSNSRSALINERAATKVRAGDPRLRDSDTTYLCTADEQGNMVSLIQSIFHPFGSTVVVPDSGFALQNRGMLFSMDPRHANVYAAGKRPFQTIIPAFVLKNGKPWMSFGVMGGDMQSQAHVQVMSHILDADMDLQQAGDMPRWRHDGSSQPTDAADSYLSDGGELILEAGVTEYLENKLEGFGHRISRDDKGMGFGGYQAIRCDENGGYSGASESRKDGCALGY